MRCRVPAAPRMCWSVSPSNSGTAWRDDALPEFRYRVAGLRIAADADRASQADGPFTRGFRIPEFRPGIPVRVPIGLPFVAPLRFALPPQERGHIKRRYRLELRPRNRRLDGVR